MLKMFLVLFFTVFAQTPTAVEIDRQSKAVEAFQEAEEELPQDFTRELINVVFALGTIIALLIGATWFMRRYMTGKMTQYNETSNIKVLDQRNISARTAIYILEVYDRHIVVAETAESTNAIAEFPIEDKPFEEYMKRNPQ